MQMVNARLTRMENCKAVFADHADISTIVDNRAQIERRAQRPRDPRNNVRVVGYEVQKTRIVYACNPFVGAKISQGGTVLFSNAFL
jgi:hypothetical protein